MGARARARQRDAAQDDDFRRAPHGAPAGAVHALPHRRVFLRLRPRRAPQLPPVSAPRARTRAHRPSALSPGVRLRLDHSRSSLLHARPLRAVRHLDRRRAAHGGDFRARSRGVSRRRAPRKLRAHERRGPAPPGPLGGDGDVRAQHQPHRHPPPGRQSRLRTRDHRARTPRGDAAYQRLPGAGQVRRHTGRPHARGCAGAGGELPRTPCAFSLGPHARRRGAQAPGDLHDWALPRWQPLPRCVPADRRLLAAHPGRPRGGGACGDRALRGGARGVLPQRSVQLVQLLRPLARRRRPRRRLDSALRERAWSGRVRRGARPAGVAAALAFAVAFAAAGTADEATSPQPVEYQQLLKLLAARRHGHVTFTEVQRLAILDRPLESSGELLYDAPDRLEKRTVNPRAETLVLEHGVLTAHRGHRTYLMPLRDYPQVAPFIESIRATLAGDREALERLFGVGFEGSLAHWSLLLVPTDARLAGAVREIRIEGERDAIRSVDLPHP